MKYLRTRNTKKKKKKNEDGKERSKRWTETKGEGESGSQVESGE